MAFSSYYPTAENKAADSTMDFLGINKSTEMEKKKFGRSTVRVEKAKQTHLSVPGMLIEK